MKFIILDEDEILKDTVYCHLDTNGHSCERTSKEKEVLELINKEHFDVVFADPSLLKHNCIDLLKIIEEIKPETKVILLNGSAMLDEANFPNIKPLDSKKLLKVIEEINKIIEQIEQENLEGLPHN